MKTKRVILCGLGKVGTAFLQLVNERALHIQTKYGFQIEVGCVATSGGAAIATEGALPLQALLDFTQSGGRPENFPGYGCRGLSAIKAIKNNDFDVLVETTPTNLIDGEPAHGFVLAAIEKGMDIVSANKGPFVLQFARLNELAAAKKSRFFLSAATGAALPTLDVGRFSTSGATITAIEGVLNGTTNFILSKMYFEKSSYLDALKEAQELGIAETDPTLDVEGLDSRNKLLLIVNTLFDKAVELNDIPVQGIAHIKFDDIEHGIKQGKVLKLVASATFNDGKMSLAVGPQYLDNTHPLASINFTEKGITYTTDTMGQITVLGGKSSPIGAAAALLKDVIHTHLFS